MDTIILYLVLYAIGFLISVIIMRAIFSIPTIIKNQKAQTRLLAEIALQQGIEKTTVNRILNEAGVNRLPLTY
jgi:hypothetical protein